jgi:hypothetical protein
MSVCRPSVRPSACNNSDNAERVFMKICVLVFLGQLSRKFKFFKNVLRIKGTLYEDRRTFMIISRTVFLRMRNISDKIGTEN